MKIDSSKHTPMYTPCTISLKFEHERELEAFTALIGRVGSIAHGIDFGNMYDVLLGFTDSGVAPLFNDLWALTPGGESILEKNFTSTSK